MKRSRRPRGGRCWSEARRGGKRQGNSKQEGECLSMEEQITDVLCISVQDSGADQEIATFAHEPGASGARVSLAYTCPRGTFQRGQHLELVLREKETVTVPLEVASGAELAAAGLARAERDAMSADEQAADRSAWAQTQAAQTQTELNAESQKSASEEPPGPEPEAPPEPAGN